MHSLRLLLYGMPLILVERRGIPGTRDPATVVPLAGRLTRREEGRAQGRPRQFHELVPVSHDPQLHANMSEGSEPRSSHRADQEAAGLLNLEKEEGGAFWFG